VAEEFDRLSRGITKIVVKAVGKVMPRWKLMLEAAPSFTKTVALQLISNTSSPESAMEFDLARFREIKDADGFVNTLEGFCNLALTEDYWKITLPNDLATSSSRSPSLFAYNAALVLLDAPALFSKIKVSELLDPVSQGTRTAVERHHLFPKEHLKELGIAGLRETNQIANYAYVEWSDIIKISDQEPADYLPDMEARFSTTELEKMYYWHALPEDWEQMDYRVFLEQRRGTQGEGLRGTFLLCHHALLTILKPTPVKRAICLRLNPSIDLSFFNIVLRSTMGISLRLASGIPPSIPLII
jgi:hypothetical protein